MQAKYSTGWAGSVGCEPDVGKGQGSNKLWALGFGLWALGFGLWALGFGLWAEYQALVSPITTAARYDCGRRYVSKSAFTARSGRYQCRESRNAAPSFFHQIRKPAEYQWGSART
ncbi:hypothetical protein EC394_12510 [Lonsdalea populi]|nr:hypothetical protein EC394_12510 [Lonsdalea populi]